MSIAAPGYRWVCHYCACSNEPSVSACARCRRGANASANDVERAQRYGAVQNSHATEEERLRGQVEDTELGHRLARIEAKSVAIASVVALVALVLLIAFMSTDFGKFALITVFLLLGARM